MNETLPAVESFISFLVETFGPQGTLWGLFGVFLLALGWRVYADMRQARYVDKALDEKERTIQRLAKQEREWRMLFLVSERGMNRRTVEKIILENDHSTPAESREALERSRRLTDA